MDQRQLISHCQSGDLDSFEELYGRYRQKALGTAYLIAGKRNIAEDIVQEAFVVCYSQIKQLKNPDVFNVWFYRLLVRIAWRMSAKQKNTVSYEDADIFRNAALSGGQAYEDMTGASEERILVREAVKKLSPPLKTVVIMYYFNELTVKEISGILDCFQGTVKSRLYKARKLLEKELRISREEENDSGLRKKELTVGG